MLTIAVCDDEATECYNLSLKIREMLGKMKVPCIVQQFNSTGKLLEAVEGFDIIFLDIIMHELDGLKAAKIFRQKAFDKILVLFLQAGSMYLMHMMWRRFIIW